MSGITGFYGRENRARAGRMCAALAHRGPAGETFFHNDTFSLGWRHLTMPGNGVLPEPLTDDTGSLRLVCSGEIYNSAELRRDLEGRGHSFRTGMGAETILHLYKEYGTGFAKHLRGAFGLALWDSTKQRLVLARDPMGQQPLFFAEADGSFSFASEVKGLLAAGNLPREPDLEALWHYISLRYLPDDKTLFKGVRKLPAAHLLVYENGRVHLERYWSLTFRKKRTEPDEVLTDELEKILLEAVGLYRAGDMPVGAFLSGGIDSGLVVAMMAKTEATPFPTFSIGVREQGYNELPYARMVAERYGLEAHEEIVEADIIRKLPTMIHHMDEPADPFGVGVFLVSQLASRRVQVVLSGDGGDENFAGYDRFAGQRMAELYGLLPAPLRRHVLGRLYRLVPESFGYKSLASKLRWMNDMSFYSRGERYARSLAFLRFTDENKEALFTPAARGQILEADSTAKILSYFDSDAADDLTDRMLYTDLMTRMPDHLLTISDRMCMAHSIVARPPLIDEKVTEFAAALPAGLKLRGRKLKHILRLVAARYLPREIIELPKQGFGFPIAQWMRTDLRVFLDRLFSESRFVERGLFREEEMRRLYDEHVNGVADHNFRLWILLNLELWHRMYFENCSISQLDAFIEEKL